MDYLCLSSPTDKVAGETLYKNRPLIINQLRLRCLRCKVELSTLRGCAVYVGTLRCPRGKVTKELSFRLIIRTPTPLRFIKIKKPICLFPFKLLHRQTKRRTGPAHPIINV